MEERLVPELRFPEFEGEWEEKKAKDFIDIIDGDRGKNYPSKTDLLSEGYCLFLSASNVTKNGFKFDKVEFITKDKDELLRSGKLSRNDIVITTRGTIGNIGLYNEDIKYENVRINSGMIILRVQDGSEKFLYFLLKSNIFDKILSIITFGSAQPQLTKRDLSSITFLIPNSNLEQQKIGDFFYKIDKKLELQQEKIENLKKYKKGMMQRIFSQEIRFKDDDGNDYPDWEEKKLGEISKVSQGLQIAINKRLLKPTKDSYFYITNEFLKEGSKIKYYVKNPPQNVICKKDHILMTRTGNTGIVVTNVEGAFHNNFFKIDYNKKLLTKEYLVLVLNSYKVQKDILIRAGQSTIPDLNHSEFYKVKISIPIKEEQTKIANCLSSIDKKIELEEEKLEEYRNLKKGLMQRMFI